MGGYLGYEFSDGDILSTSVGSAVGVVLGGYLVDFINTTDPIEREKALKELKATLEKDSKPQDSWKMQSMDGTKKEA